METPKQKLSIAMVCDPIGSNKSGVVVSTLRFAKLLRERGHKVIFIGARSKEHKNNTHYNDTRIHLYRSIPIPKSGGWNWALPRKEELKQVFQEEKIDVVHIVLPMGAAIVAIRAAKALNIKIVAHSHSQPENLFTDMPKIIQPLLNDLWNRYLSWIYGKSDILIYPSEMARTLLEKLNQKNHPSIVISNGINRQEFRPLPIHNFLHRFKIPENKIKLLFLGRLFPEKSVDTLIKAVPYMIGRQAPAHVMIVGDGHMRSKLEKLTEQLGIGRYVTFLGLISEEDKILAYNGSDIFVMPSLAELEGMAVLEAMACGKPILISDAKMSAARHFVNGNGFLFKSGDCRDLAEQALKLIHDRPLRQKFGQVSLEKSKDYDIHRSADLLEKTYYGVLRNKNDRI